MTFQTLESRRLLAATSEPPDLFVVEVISERQHDPLAFTQGLVWHQGRLYESTGLRGHSSLREVDPQTGDVLRQHDLADQHFGEGLALVGDRLVQLTWQSETALQYKLDTFEPDRQFAYSGEGWGLCYDGNRLIRSDGSSSLFFHDPSTFEPIGSVAVTRAGQPQTLLNELECVGDSVFANIWTTDTIVRIDPETGYIVSEIDASGLLNDHQRRDADVLNGIAYDQDSGNFLITGKFWPKLFEVQFAPVTPGIRVGSIEATRNPNGEYMIELSAGETIDAGPEWVVQQPYIEDDALIRPVTRDDITVKIHGPTAWQNPIRSADVNLSGDVSALDALVVVNALASVDGTLKSQELGLPTVEQLGNFSFFDVTGDGNLTALDALSVIHEISRLEESTQINPAAGELLLAQSLSETGRGDRKLTCNHAIVLLF